MSESVLFSASQASHGCFHTAIGQLMLLRMFAKVRCKWKIDRFTTPNNNPSSKTTTPMLLVGPVSDIRTRKDDSQ